MGKGNEEGRGGGLTHTMGERGRDIGERKQGKGVEDMDLVVAVAATTGTATTTALLVTGGGAPCPAHT